MATNKEELINWLAGVSNDAEIGIEIGTFGQRALMAVCDSEGETLRSVSLLEIGDVPYPEEQADAEASRERMMNKLRQLHAGGKPEKGVMIVTIEGAISGAPDLFSMSVREAFAFKDRTQAKIFIDDFYDMLKHALILAC
jgi:hypothetical protein